VGKSDTGYGFKIIPTVSTSIFFAFSIKKIIFVKT
jgi:hypothetical protein